MAKKVHFRKSYQLAPKCGIPDEYDPKITDIEGEVTCKRCKVSLNKFPDIDELIPEVLLWILHKIKPDEYVDEETENAMNLIFNSLEREDNLLDETLDLEQFLEACQRGEELDDDELAKYCPEEKVHLEALDSEYQRLSGKIDEKIKSLNLCPETFRDSLSDSKGKLKKYLKKEKVLKS